jgi:hypothetical protein
MRIKWSFDPVGARTRKLLSYKGMELLRDNPKTRARGCLVAKAWNWVVFQKTSVSRKSFRSIDHNKACRFPQWVL